MGNRLQFTASQAPIFTLYGDGTVIFRNPAQDPLEPVANVYPNHPYRIAKLSEEQIQALLTSAIGEGGLGAARANYENNMVADASTAIFTLSAGGMTKTVSIYALGIENQAGDRPYGNDLDPTLNLDVLELCFRNCDRWQIIVSPQRLATIHKIIHFQRRLAENETDERGREAHRHGINSAGSSR